MSSLHETMRLLGARSEAPAAVPGLLPAANRCAGHRCLTQDEQRRHPGPDRDCEVRRGDLLDVQLDHDVFGDPPAFGGTILQTIKAVLHLGYTLSPEIATLSDPCCCACVTISSMRRCKSA